MTLFFRFWIVVMMLAFATQAGAEPPAGPSLMAPPFDLSGVNRACKDKIEAIQATMDLFQTKCATWGSYDTLDLNCFKRGIDSIFNGESFSKMAPAVCATLAGDTSRQLVCLTELVQLWGDGPKSVQYSANPRAPIVSLLVPPFQTSNGDAVCDTSIASLRATIKHFQTKCEGWGSYDTVDLNCFKRAITAVFKEEALQDFAIPLCGTLADSSQQAACLKSLIDQWGNRGLQTTSMACSKVSDSGQRLACLQEAIRLAN